MDIKKKKIREIIQDLTLFDDELMTLAFHEDCEFTEFLLNAICPQAGFKVTDVRTQQTLPNIMGRSLKLDILANDAFGRKVNIEVQQLPKGAAPVRARFHSSLLDVHLLEKGQSFDDLPTTYIIFMTKTDVLGGGLPVYTVERQIQELQKPFDDKTVILYVNGACMDDTLLGRIMHDFQCASPNKMKCQTVANKLKDIKNSEEERSMGALFDMFYDEGRDKGLEEGHNKGLEEGAQRKCVQMICKHMRKSQCTLDEALEWFDVSENELENIKNLVRIELNHNQTPFNSTQQFEQLKGKADLISNYIQKFKCTAGEAFDIFDILEAERKQLERLIQI